MLKRRAMLAEADEGMIDEVERELGIVFARDVDELAILGVHPAHRRQGVGSALVRSFLKVRTYGMTPLTRRPGPSREPTDVHAAGDRLLQDAGLRHRRQPRSRHVPLHTDALDAGVALGVIAQASCRQSRQSGGQSALSFAPSCLAQMRSL